MLKAHAGPVQGLTPNQTLPQALTLNTIKWAKAGVAWVDCSCQAMKAYCRQDNLLQLPATRVHLGKLLKHAVGTSLC